MFSVNIVMNNTEQMIRDNARRNAEKKKITIHCRGLAAPESDLHYLFLTRK